MPLAIAQKSDEDLIAEILAMLDRWDARLNGHQNQKREHPRVPFRSQIVVELPDLADFEDVSEEDAQLRVWARNITPAGVGFLYRKLTGDEIALAFESEDYLLLEASGLEEEGENILVHRVPVADAFQLLVENRVPNGHTLISLLWLQNNIESLRQRWS